MAVISVPHAFNEEDLYVDLRSIFGHPLFLKCEGFNFAGSIKLKAATEMVEAAARDGTLKPGSVLVESSSGNLGVALSMIAASKGYQFLCVTDSRCNLPTRLLMEALGSQVHIITKPDAASGFLGARLDYVRALCASDDRYVWLNQYTNPANWRAHYRRTAPAIGRQFPNLDVVFVGAGTTGTLMGCARYFREWHRPVWVVAVDSVGSVAFGGAPGRRMIPGLGTSVLPPLLDESFVDEVVRVEEADTIRACHHLAKHGFLFGGSTGTVVSGAMSWLARHEAHDHTAVAIAPDLGERYLDTIYQANWLHDLYGADVFSPGELADASSQPQPLPPGRSPARLSRNYRASSSGGHMTGNPEALTADPAGASTTRGGYAGLTAGTETVLTMMLADVMHVERVPPDSNFFDDLGADSLVMAHFCARVRKQPDLPPISMRDIYRHPTIRGLATVLADTAPAALGDVAPAPAESPVLAAAGAAIPASTGQYLLCGALQFLSFLGYTYIVAVVAAWAYDWIPASSSPVNSYLRSVVFGAALLVIVGTLPVAAKWILIGRWKPQQIPVWSLAYFRFWLVKTLVQKNPLVLLSVGSPIYSLYLRALGAKVGPGVVIFSRHVPVCTDLLTVGGGAVIRKNAFLQCYRAQAGWIETGAVTIGKDAFVGEMTVIDIETSLGDGSQLGHSSSLHSGQAVPDGECWHGSPAQRTEVNYRTVGPARCGSLRRTVHTAQQLLFLLGVVLPLAIGGVDLLLADAPQAHVTLDTNLGVRTFTSWPSYRVALIVSAVLFFGGTAAGIFFVCTVPRLLSIAIKPGKVYPLYGFHYAVHRAIRLMTNVKFFNTIFGDSSGIIHYLRWLGVKLPAFEQTGSNFGTQIHHENPYLSMVGGGTMVADGLSIVNADFSSTSFRVSPASIGRHNFLGNFVAYPSQGSTGDNCLLATKVLVPIDGKVREGVGLLGSPSFEIPRSVERDGKFDDLKTAEGFRHRLAAKNRHNAVTVGMHLLTRWFYFFVVLMIGWATADAYGTLGAMLIAVASVVTLLFSVLFFVLVERTIQVFLPLRPLYCSIYDRRFWRHERFWKGAALTVHVQMFNGTPFKNLVWRLLGVRIGRRVFDDGAGLVEKTLVTIGDDVTLNVGSIVQAHSQEDGAFKSDRITIGSGCTIGIGAWVHYGVAMGDGAVLAPDSFLMKGEEVPAGARWGGNPAREIQGGQYQLSQRSTGGTARPACGPPETATTTAAPSLPAVRGTVPAVSEGKAR